MSRVFVKPAPDRLVMIPNRPRQFVPEGGMEMELDRYVQRCIDRGDLVVAPTPAAAAPAAPAATVKKE